MSREAGEPYRDRLLPLPAFLAGPPTGRAEPAGLEEAFLLTGYFLERHVFDARGRGAAGGAARAFSEPISGAVEAAA